MKLAASDADEATLPRLHVRLSLRCQAVECRAFLGKAHILGVGVVEMACAKCGALSEFDWGFQGVTGRVLDFVKRHGDNPRR